MKLKIINKDGADKGSIDLPEQFSEPIRKDIVKRAVITIQANARQPYGASPEAGKRASAYVSKRRRKYKGTYGIGQSRTPRKVLNRNGTRFYHVGAFAPQTVGGRRAHPPKASKIWDQKINESENRKAIRVALTACLNPEIVKERGHKIPSTYPFIISEEFNKINKTSELRKSLLTLGFKDELERASIKKIRAGKGKARGRKYKTKTSTLIVLGDESELTKSAKNFPGVQVVNVQSLNAEILAPGAEMGRVTLFTESAIKKMTELKLFTKDYKGETKKKQPKKQTPVEKEPVKKKKAKKTVKKTTKKATKKEEAK